MRERIEELLDDMLNPPNGQVDIKEFRDRIVALHSECSSVEDRTTLIQFYCELMDLAERQGGPQGIDLEALRNVRAAEMRLFCIKEAMRDDGMIDQDEFLRVFSREFEAGRMPADDYLELARAGAVVFGSAEKPQAPKGRGLLSRLFGRA